MRGKNALHNLCSEKVSARLRSPFAVVVFLVASTAGAAGPDVARAVNGCPIRPATLCVEFNLEHAQLAKADLSQAALSRANLSGADLQGADLRYADLDGANLRGTDMSLALLDHIEAQTADMTEAASGEPA
jgi:hypothetical protein